MGEQAWGKCKISREYHQNFLPFCLRCFWLTLMHFWPQKDQLFLKNIPLKSKISLWFAEFPWNEIPKLHIIFTVWCHVNTIPEYLGPGFFLPQLRPQPSEGQQHSGIHVNILGHWYESERVLEYMYHIIPIKRPCPYYKRPPMFFSPIIVTNFPLEISYFKLARNRILTGLYSAISWLLTNILIGGAIYCDHMFLRCFSTSQ